MRAEVNRSGVVLCSPHPTPPPSDEGMSSQAAGPPTAAPRGTSQGKVNPYSVIDITPFQPQQLLQQPPQASVPASSSSCPAAEQEPEAQEVASSPGVPSGYSVPVPCGYAVPSNVPMITPAYTTPVIIRHFSMDEDGNGHYNAPPPLPPFSLYLSFCHSSI